jgi:hypothetical protein
MRTALSFSLCLLALFSAGCAADRSPSPEAGPGLQSTIAAPDSMGTLLVFSSWDRLSNSSDSMWIRHTDYSILDTDGKIIRQIKNHNLGPDSRPVAVQLPSGKYVVRARKQGSGWVSVPVNLTGGNTSEIYLDDSSRPVPRENHTVQVIK